MTILRGIVAAWQPHREVGDAKPLGLDATETAWLPAFSSILPAARLRFRLA